MQPDDPLTIALVTAIRTGDVAGLRQLLSENPGLENERVPGRKGGWRTPLHFVADWPGYFPNGPEVVRVLIAAGADPNAPGGPPPSETPLHWAASSDDVDVAEALIAGGAYIEAPGASIAGGAPLDDAVGYACWRVARLLVARGARVDKLWHAAALGLLPRLAKLAPSASAEELNQAFWHACSGGQRRAAEYLLARGADPHWQPDYAKEPALEAAQRLDTGRQALIGWLEDISKAPSTSGGEGRQAGLGTVGSEP